MLALSQRPCSLGDSLEGETLIVCVHSSVESVTCYAR